MYKDLLDPVARMMIHGYFATGEYSRSFLADFGTPPTLMAKAHHLRSVIQAHLTDNPSFDLGKSFAEFGRVEVAHVESGLVFVMRSEGAIGAERRRAEPGFIDANDYLQLQPRHELLLVYSFGPRDLTLSLASAWAKPKSSRLEMLGRPHLVDVWPYLDHGGDGPFDQGYGDLFEDLGDLDLDEGQG